MLAGRRQQLAQNGQPLRAEVETQPLITLTEKNGVPLQLTARHITGLQPSSTPEPLSPPRLTPGLATA